MSERRAADGSFTFSDLPAGEYFIAALSDLDPLEWQDPAFLAQVVPAAIKVTLAEGEKKRQDLRVKQLPRVRLAHGPLPGLRVRV